MAHKKIVYVESPFILKWFRLDYLDVLSFQNYLRSNWYSVPERYKQPLLNLYNSLNHPKNPRNLKFYE